MAAEACVLATSIGPQLVRSLEKLSYSPKILFQTNSPADQSYPTAVGAKNTEGVFTMEAWSPKASYPGNAEIYQEGALVGNSPYALSKPESGKDVKLELRLPGYDTKVVTISAATGSSIGVNLAKKPEDMPKAEEKPKADDQSGAGDLLK